MVGIGKGCIELAEKDVLVQIQAVSDLHLALLGDSLRQLAATRIMLRPTSITAVGSSHCDQASMPKRLYVHPLPCHVLYC